MKKKRVESTYISLLLSQTCESAWWKWNRNLGRLYAVALKLKAD